MQTLSSLVGIVNRFKSNIILDRSTGTLPSRLHLTKQHQQAMEIQLDAIIWHLKGSTHHVDHRLVHKEYNQYFKEVQGLCLAALINKHRLQLAQCTTIDDVKALVTFICKTLDVLRQDLQHDWSTDEADFDSDTVRILCLQREFAVSKAVALKAASHPPMFSGDRYIAAKHDIWLTFCDGSNALFFLFESLWLPKVRGGQKGADRRAGLCICFRWLNYFPEVLNQKQVDQIRLQLFRESFDNPGRVPRQIPAWTNSPSSERGDSLLDELEDISGEYRIVIHRPIPEFVRKNVATLVALVEDFEADFAFVNRKRLPTHLHLSTEHRSAVDTSFKAILDMAVQLSPSHEKRLARHEYTRHMNTIQGLVLAALVEKHRLQLLQCKSKQDVEILVHEICHVLDTFRSKHQDSWRCYRDNPFNKSVRDLCLDREFGVAKELAMKTAPNAFLKQADGDQDPKSNDGQWTMQELQAYVFDGIGPLFYFHEIMWQPEILSADEATIRAVRNSYHPPSSLSQIPFSLLREVSSTSDF
ncbi:hypothetical protein OIV83_001784 [Microbotryomycetes sp. JL201]|nr:hypothetical protein OIV83_001784 [Microbotryomycetes sp. JL201]